MSGQRRSLVHVQLFQGLGRRELHGTGPKCAKSPCKTGTCNFTGDRKYTCDCPPTHYGNDCQFFNVCSSYPCQNNAECIAHDNETFTCICPDNFVGEMCELPDPCTPSQCVHGNCSAFNNNTGFTCANVRTDIAGICVI